MIAALPITLILATLGQTVPTAPAGLNQPDAGPARLKYMTESVAAYAVRPAGVDAKPWRLVPEPIFRLNNAVSGVNDGAIYLWTDAIGRPSAAVQVFHIKYGVWLHEFSSLAPDPFAAESGTIATWHPDRPGLEFRPVPDAPKPAATPAQRQRQMASIAAEFAAEDDFEGKGWLALRLLPKSLVRYGQAGGKVEDGALFALVMGTDPEVFVLIESRPGPDGPAWHYALAPMTAYALKATHKGRAVWSQPWTRDAKDPAAPFYDMVLSKDPER